MTTARVGRPFAPGQSGNPGGRPAVEREFRERCREFMDERGWERLMRLASGRGVFAFRALELVAAYAYGKPTQLVGGDPAMPPLQFTLNISRDTDEGPVFDGSLGSQVPAPLVTLPVSPPLETPDDAMGLTDAAANG